MLEGKVVPVQKLSEWWGLDQIAGVVHAMKCIWREQAKDDLGVDGEIELCSPRSDGDGMLGTGKIIKVQSKSGRRYVTRDEIATFETPIAASDLRYWRGMNVPVIFVVAHPGERKLYWKDIKSYPFSSAKDEPLRVVFDKAKDELSTEAVDLLWTVCSSAPDRVDRDARETLSANLLEIIEPPPAVYRTTVLPEKRTQFRQRLTGGFVPPLAYRSGAVLTLTDPHDTDNALRSVIEGESTRIPVAEFIATVDSGEADYRYLLKLLMHKHLVRRGLHFDRENLQYFIREGISPDTPVSVEWISSRTGRTSRRKVGKFVGTGPGGYYQFLALEVGVERVGESWAFLLDPRHFYSQDGKTKWISKVAISHLIRNRAREFNAQYLNHILFWSYVLAQGAQEFGLRLDHHDVARVSGVPASAVASFGIRTTASGKK